MGVRERFGDIVGDFIGLLDDVIPPRCPIPWRPHVFAPVFNGYRDLTREGELIQARTALIDQAVGIDLGAPVPMRVLFPSIGGSPQHNEILWPCGQFPLVILAHGQCFKVGVPVAQAQRIHYLAWARGRIAHQVARAGYVVAVPQLGGVLPNSDADLDILRQVIDFMRNDWVHASLLAPASQTALIGHSRGAIHAARLAAEGGFACYAGLSGDFIDWRSIDPTAVDQLASISIPTLFTTGSEEQVLDLSWKPKADGSRQEGTWQRLLGPKHEVVIDKMEHFDYLAPGVAPCQDPPGPCGQSPAIMADVVALFLGRYLRPPAVHPIASHVDATLVAPEDWDHFLTLKQRFFAGSYLTGFAALQGAVPKCPTTITFELESGEGGVTAFP